MVEEIRFGCRIRQLREAAGLTQTELANTSGLSQTRISSLECGSLPHAGDMVALREVIPLFPRNDPTVLVEHVEAWLRAHQSRRP